jgi:2-succinyl-5-enolpyruvyl-6-hydroxy-3-cyclohexene-1-carboxylate synthase
VTPPTLLTQWARLLLGSLRGAGLRDVVLSPGSRSTPFTSAALNDPGLRCRVIIDERAAAFFAVGHARITGRPVLLVCTSGTAGANYFPAVIEAAEAGTPLLVLTADRPLELQAAAAPQTIDQMGLFGGHVRAFFELGTPDADPRALRALPRIAAQAHAAALDPVPGPVHLNARARKPLEPTEAGTPESEALGATVDGLLERVPRYAAPTAMPDPDAISALARACRGARSGLIVCGPAAIARAAAPADVDGLARATGFPVVAEAASQARFGSPVAGVLDAFPALLDVPAFVEGNAPDVVIQVGRPPTASAWHGAIPAWQDVTRHVLADRGWPDPWTGAAAVIRAPLGAAIRALTARLSEDAGPDETRRARDDWAASVRGADQRAREAIHASLGEGFPEGEAVRVVVESLEPGSVLALGNSLPIREVDLFVPAGDRGLAVWSQRGANGIDGLVAGAAGAAAASGRPTTLLLGDVSLAHDLGGLATLRDLPAPLTVVVLNNGGGRIFDRLPIAETLHDDPRMDAWLTPPDIDFRAAAAAFGLEYAVARDAGATVRGLEALRRSGGVLEVVVPEGGTTTHQLELRREIRRRFGA